MNNQTDKSNCIKNNQKQCSDKQLKNFPLPKFFDPEDEKFEKEHSEFDFNNSTKPFDFEDKSEDYSSLIKNIHNHSTPTLNKVKNNFINPYYQPSCKHRSQEFYDPKAVYRRTFPSFYHNSNSQEANFSYKSCNNLIKIF